VANAPKSAATSHTQEVAKPRKPVPKASAAHGVARPLRSTVVAPPSKPATEPAAAPAPEPAESEAPATESPEPIVSRRDPFAPLINTAQPGPQNLPPGKAGLVISTVRVDGAVKSGNGMIAVVSNPQEHVYFVREGDRLYDGSVEKIGLDGVTFKENSRDAFGKPVERLVTKRIYPSAGEQQ
jgi:Tfp pilus assembly protein PilP